MNCKNVIIFYESHRDKAAAKTIGSLTNYFKQNNYKSYCFEEPSDESKELLLQTYKKQYQYLKSNIKSFEEPYVYKFIASHLPMFIDENGEYKSKFSSQEKVEILDYIRSYNKNMADSFQSTIKLIRQTDEEELHFCSMDMPRSMRTELNTHGKNLIEQRNIRDEYMHNKIFEQCNNYGDVVVLVGANHFKIADLLRAKKVNVKEYFVTSEERAPNQLELADLCLRTKTKDPACSGHKLNGLVIDLYENPTLDAVQLIADDLYKFHDEL